MAGEYAKLIKEEGMDALAQLSFSFAEVIEGSFIVDCSRYTRAEVTRRFDICADLFRTMRGDLKWSKQRILDELPRALRCKLDGADWTPQREGKDTYRATGSPIWLPD